MRNFDYVVVGAGSAGCVVANRLSANGRYSVLVLEAGKARHWLSPVPVGVAKLIDDPSANWCFAAEPEASLNGRQIPVPRGKLLGGSSAINGMVYVRGQALDFDTWAQLGNRGWSYEDVLPAFKTLENYEAGADEYRATGGPLNVSVTNDQNPFYDGLFAAADELGLPRNPDYNGADQEGMCMTQATISNGRRMSAAHCFLTPATKRSNVTVETETLVTRLTFEGTRCAGIQYRHNGERREVRANLEVVLSAGAINSPQILELSGVGQPQRLQSLGIEVHHALEGVGENLRDHLSPRLGWGLKQKGVSYNDKASGLGLLWHGLKYLTAKRGFLSLPTAPMLAFVKTREGLASPDVQIHFLPYTFTAARRLHKSPGITALIYQLRPESTGDIHIKSADAVDAPAINFNFLSNELDRTTTIASVRLTRKIMETNALADLTGTEFKPGTAVETDDEILDWVARSAETAYHPVGTCKMGSDPRAVVDERLRVRGVAGLRVADASIMPTLVSGNTNAASMMIGERAAAMILEDSA